MWIDDLGGKSWTTLWSDYVVCGHACNGLRTFHAPCPVCGAPEPYDNAQEVANGAGVKFGPTYMGGEGRYEDYIYLQMLEREWARPVVKFRGLSSAEAPSARAVFVIVFWSYFETRIERLLRFAMRNLAAADLDRRLERNAGIGSRLYGLYERQFGLTYFDDLRSLGHSDVADLVKDLHERRNRFAHGFPQAITDATVNDLIENLKAEHESWIAVFNKHAHP